jgi:CheY-like chemotaxis protein
MTEQLDKVLLVDDDRVTNLLHTRMINRSGLVRQVDVATDGMDALEYLQDDDRNGGVQPDLILLDINMPRMNGFEFLEAYAHLPDVPKDQQIIVMLSTSLLKSDHARAEADPNVYQFANKPLRPDALSDLVRDVQQHRHAT